MEPEIIIDSLLFHSVASEMAQREERRKSQSSKSG